MREGQISRRSFLGRAVTITVGFTLLAAKPLSDIFHRYFSPSRAAVPLVLRMQPVAGVRYSRAALNHMRNRIFPSREALVAELPHRGLIFTIEQVPVTLSQDDLNKLFAGKRSLDVRRTADRRSSETILIAMEKGDGSLLSTG